MSEVARFLASMINDETFAASVKEAKAKASSREEEIEAVVALAKANGFEVDGKELEAAVSEVIKFSQSDELTDEELEKASGGWFGILSPLLYKGFDSAMDAAGMAEANRQVLNGINPQVGKSYDNNVQMGGLMINAGETAGNAIAGAATDVGNAIASAFSGW